ncbi:pirin family protein [Massilia glaciei]|uniref:pirin family protein n=1 Tax=Massilia glaciei TaxID=1524097 RepID=UPI001C6356E4|nr:pirin family protein [Massilia glaciei]
MTHRPLPSPGVDLIDPFLFLNHHGPQSYAPHNAGLPFGPHPHRGFETVTFILEGMLTHRDSAGHESTIGAGGVQWMTAGRGIIHAELSPAAFKERGGPLEIIQLWVNLPARLKMTAPAYHGLQRGDIPALALANGKARMHLVAGRWDGASGPVDSLTGVFMSSIALEPGALLRLPGLEGRNVLLYVVRGALRVGADLLRAFEMAELDDGADTLVLHAEAETLVLFGHAEPIGEPVVSHGPFVMNTRDEIGDAIADYQAGYFGKAV